MYERMLLAEEVLPKNINVVVGEPIGVGEGSIHTDISAEEAQSLAELLPNYLVPVAKDAPGSCFDGRDCVGCLDNTDTEPRHSVAGGPLVSAYAMAVLTNWFGENAPQSLQQRLTLLKDTLEVGGIRLGGHVDEVALASDYINHQTQKPATGCGADDKAPRAAEISALIASQAAADDEAVTALFRNFMDETFDANKLAGIADAQRTISAYDDWDPLAPLQAVISSSPHGVEVLRADETPTHGHNEALAAAVKVPGMTIDQKALFRDTGYQIFPIDVPYIDRIAKTMAGGPRADEQYEALRHTGVAYQAGVYVALCDGSQRFVSVSMVENPAEA